MPGLLLDLIRQGREHRKQHPPSTYPPAWVCPINQTECGRDCFIRHACHTRSRELIALLERMDEQTAAAIGLHLKGDQ